jgi:catechol 2,3-dioxygenase-like lactoylglutathione lyase family enzyme
MTDERPPPLLGLRHVALWVPDLEGAERFWCEVMGYRVEWRPDSHNVYLSTGTDNLALHRAPPGPSESTPSPEIGTPAPAYAPPPQRLDHIGLAVPAPEDVDAWAVRLTARGTVVKAPPRTHRDGSRSLYFEAPDGTLVQIIHLGPGR